MMKQSGIKFLIDSIHIFDSDYLQLFLKKTSKYTQDMFKLIDPKENYRIGRFLLTNTKTTWGNGRIELKDKVIEYEIEESIQLSQKEFLKETLSVFGYSEKRIHSCLENTDYEDHTILWQHRRNVRTFTEYSPLIYLKGILTHYMQVYNLCSEELRWSLSVGLKYKVTDRRHTTAPYTYENEDLFPKVLSIINNNYYKDYINEFEKIV